jgi:hypothetical protein
MERELYRWVKASEKPLHYEVINIDRLILYGKEKGANLVNGMPWSFNYKGYPVTHETDNCYLVGTEGVKCTKTDEVLLFNGKAYPTWGFNVKVHILYDGTPRILTFGEYRWCFYVEGHGSAVRVKDLWDTNENEWAKIEYLERVDASEPPPTFTPKTFISREAAWEDEKQAEMTKALREYGIDTMRLEDDFNCHLFAAMEQYRLRMLEHFKL